MSEPFSRVLLDELKAIDERRAVVRPGAPAPPLTTARPAEDQALERNLVGMGISGGGIRSATFNLGILQGLADHGLLRHLDYLSTVSGGGYIGSWLHAVISRKGKGLPDRIDDQLSPERNPVPGDAADDPVSFLRKYSNYLAPRVSLFSADVWVIAAIWVRNMFLNWCVLVPFLAAALLLPVVGGLVQQELDRSGHERLLYLSLFPAAFMLAAAVLIMGARLREAAQRTFIENARTAIKPKLDAGLCAMLVFLAAVLIGATQTDPLNWYWWGRAIAPGALLLLFLVLQATGGFLPCYCGRHDSGVKGAVFWTLLISVICAAFTSALLAILLWWMSGWQDPAGVWRTLTLGPPLVIAAISAGVTMQLGLMGVDYPDAAREWVSRLGALLAIWSAAWVAMFALGVYAPLWIAWLFYASSTIGVAAAGSWIATTAAGVMSANSGKTRDGRPGNSSHAVLEVFAKIAPGVFMAGFLALISFGLHSGIRQLAGRNTASAAPARQRLSVDLRSADGNGVAVSASQPGQIQVSVPAQGEQKLEVESKSAGAPAWTARVIDNHWPALQTRAGMTWKIAAIFAGLVLVSLLFAARININEFSMHHFYKNRLVRCYLGASKGRLRQANSWTGFDPQDDMPLKDLYAGQKYYGPYPIVNTAVNLNRGSELAKAERKAGSFVFSPLYCGFTPEDSDADHAAVAAETDLHAHGYRATENYGGKGGPQLGSAMAISGAAANPNMGFHTSGAVAFLLTVFNVRLGWWVGNPRRDGPSAKPGPPSSLLYLVNELAGRTDDRSHYVNLSDGGHFDNLGLYELVRRRCRYIIIGDGEQDPGLTFGSLAGAIRKCQTDFGVTITLDVHSIQETNGLSRAHCVIGTIAYPETGPGGTFSNDGVPLPSDYGTGLLLYFKASLTGDEPEDVREYRARFAEFPHQSTGDQFFTESQFESYRNLGLHIARTALDEMGRDIRTDDLFRQLRRNWSPPPSAAEGVASRLAAAYSALLDQLKNDNDLRYLDSEIVPGLLPFAGTPSADALRKGHLYCMDCIRLAESVYTDLQFRVLKERQNRSNQGWIAIFRYWAAQPHIREVWQTMKVTMNPHFQQFFQSLIDGE